MNLFVKRKSYNDEKHHHHHHHHKKDDADLFREQSMRAIHRRKVIPKILMWVVSAIAAIVVAAVFAAYFLDK